MTDIKTPEERSVNMSAIRSKNTKPELFVRKMLFQDGYRYRVNTKTVPGHPDLWLKKYNTAIFINGCFWHRHRNCKYAYMPKSRVEFWNNKFNKNIERDTLVYSQLSEKKIKCLVIWECSIKKAKKDPEAEMLLEKQIIEFLNSLDLFQEI